MVIEPNISIVARIEELDEIGSGEMDESGVETKDARAMHGSQAQARVTAPALWNVSLRLTLLCLPRRALAAARARRFTTCARHLSLLLHPDLDRVPLDDGECLLVESPVLQLAAIKCTRLHRKSHSQER